MDLIHFEVVNYKSFNFHCSIVHCFWRLKDFYLGSMSFSTLKNIQNDVCVCVSPRMAKMTMKKSSSSRMSIKGGRDWKI
jgi:hypothetical protein